MGLADDLLDVAERLANPATTEPEEASLRRAVSTAYYALFHLLVEEAATLWHGGSAASRRRLGRTLQHAPMWEVSKAFSKERWIDWNNETVVLPLELRLVAERFASLQEDRHDADYNRGRSWTLLEAQSTVADTRQAFQQWREVRTAPIAQDYLLALLTGPKRR